MGLMVPGLVGSWWELMGLQEGGGDLAHWGANVLMMVLSHMQAEPCWGIAALLHSSRGVREPCGALDGSRSFSITQPSEARVMGHFTRMRSEGWDPIRHLTLRVQEDA